MTMDGWTVAGRTFRTKADFEAAKRDLQKIEKIRQQNKLNDLNVLNKIISEIDSGQYPFKTLLGHDFRDELAACAETRAKSVEKTGKKGKKDSKDRKKHSQKKTAEQKQIQLEDFDPKLQQEIMKQLHLHEKKRRRLVAVFSLLACACIGYVAFYYFLYEKNTQEYDQLSEMVEDSAITANNPTVHLTDENQELPDVLTKYKKLYQKNKKLIGWVKIDDTNIDYPVMQTVNNEYYLTHNFEQEYDKNGSIFMDKDCDPVKPSNNLIIYGHHMKSGNMFGDLNLYSSKEYWEDHPQIQFDTIYATGVYDILYVFRSRIYNQNEIIFKYYQFIDANSKDEFNSYMEEMQKMSLYDTGVTAYYGEQLLTLSTCDSAEEDGRFVVVAKKVK